jgi:hypothetical protein
MGAFVAGTYYGTYGGVHLGITEQGYELDQQTFEELIRGDNFGDGVQDSVFRGADYFLRAVFEEWASTAIDPIINPPGTDGGVTLGLRPAADGTYPPFFPWNTLSAFGTSGVIGRLGTGVAKQIILTPAASTPAAVVGQLFAEAITFPLCKLQENQTTTVTLSTRHRKIGLRFRIFPQSQTASSPTGTWFTPSNDVA